LKDLFNMENRDILNALLKKAYANGFRKYSVWNACRIDEAEDGICFYDSSNGFHGYYPLAYFDHRNDFYRQYRIIPNVPSETVGNPYYIIYDHDFAKAVWGEEWQTRLQEMVLVERPLLYHYLKQFIC